MKKVSEKNDDLKQNLLEILKEISPGSREWVAGRIAEVQKGGEKDFNLAFAMVVRGLGQDYRKKNTISICLNEVNLTGWEIGEIVRLILLLSFPRENKEKYISLVKNLFQTGDVKELELLQKSLHLLPFPEDMLFFAGEGVRSNMVNVYEAITLNNPFPYYHFSENAWNQMVIKAVFTNKPVAKIFRSDERRNPELARMVVDLAHERWAADREIPADSWRLVAPFINHLNLQDFKKMLEKGTEQEKKAAALSCLESNFTEAKELVRQFPEYYILASDKKITWELL
jgi:hypothetical protein